MSVHPQPLELAAFPGVKRVFRGSEALAAGQVNRYQLGRKFQRVFPDVYAPVGPLSLQDRTVAAWLWSGRLAIVTGQAAAALHGSRWVDPDVPVELNFGNNRSPRGIITRRESLPAGEIGRRGGLPVTTVARTAFDLSRRGPRRRAIADVDALANATRLSTGEVFAIAGRHPHLRGLRHVADRLDSVDGGAQSPRETYLRLDLIGAGFPPPHTQIAVARPEGRWYYLDMGWPDLMLAVEYDGEQHRTDRARYYGDVVRLEYLASRGWIVIRVLADHRRADIIGRVHRAWESRLGCAAG
ncbi:endonuclease domain-containing protein [Mycolicibacterium komossense]|uniref:DUF559 domain-containing protein n=1 Tax=Mycolicibacterium komossense TaxID=1779 RepID=A0ABT3CH57_9MYCO|nr:hypothetical protein [Mycolicibacterium komossense]MCV7228846.1 hypothetical protein [Mycolicibacterium komossense]